MQRAAIAAIALLAAAAARAAAPPEVRPANLSVAIVSLRQGMPGRRVEAKTRPGEAVLLRDETDVPLGKGASAATGLVATVVAEVGTGGLTLRVEAAVKSLEPGAGGPVVSSRTYSQVLQPEVVGSAWHASATWPGTGFGIDVTATPTALQPPRAAQARR